MVRANCRIMPPLLGAAEWIAVEEGGKWEFTIKGASCKIAGLSEII